MIATLAVIRETFGGPEQYCKDVVGLTDEEIEAVKRNLIMDEPAFHKF